MLVTVVANIASALIGLVTVTTFFDNGVAWMFAFHGTFRLAIIFLAPVALGFINAIIERTVARYGFAVPINGKRFLTLAATNFLSIVVTIIGNYVA